MKNNIVFSLFIFHLLISMPGYSQVSISADGSAPATGAMLEVKSDSKGVLLPRIDYNSRPSLPVAGMLIYVTANGPYGNGLYMGNGSVWLKVGTVNYTVGDIIGGQMIFYVDATGQHGLMAPRADQGTGSYGCNSTLVGTSAQHYGLFTGDQNSAAILANCSETDKAAKICDTLTLGGFSDWYLPSIDELDTLFNKKNLVGGFQEYGWYWSSTEQDATYALFHYNDVSYIPYWGALKSYNWMNVRCVRKF